MPFEPGNTHGKGRPPGSPNKKPRLGTVREALIKQGVDLGKEIVALLRHPDATVSDKIKVVQLMIQYTQVTPTAEEPADEDTTTSRLKTVSDEDLGKGLKEA